MRTYEIYVASSGEVIATIKAESAQEAWELLCADIGYDGAPGEDVVIVVLDNLDT